MKGFEKLAVNILVIFFALSGCVAYKDGKNGALLTVGKSQYKVRKGDSLYAIAFKYGLDYKVIAKANRLSPPYTIYVGQILQLQESSRLFITDQSHQEQSFFNVSQAPVYPKNQNKPQQQRISPKQNKVIENKKTNRAKNTGNSTPNRLVIKTKHKKTTLSSGKWVHPVKGTVVRKFSASGRQNKGIDYAAKLGTDVISSRSGQVVYAGSRLKGYGKLIIIKHDDAYLSAYAHNSAIKVKEGDVIKQGQKIAEVGQTGASSPKLHFEIRKYGKPVDPLPLLVKVK